MQSVVDFVPIDSHIVVHQDIAEASYGSQLPSEVRLQDTQLAHAQNGIVVVDWLPSAFYGDDAMADVDAALGRDFQVALYDVAQVGVFVEVTPWPVCERLQPGQAFAQFV